MSEQLSSGLNESLMEMRDEELQQATATFEDLWRNGGVRTELGLDEYVDLSRTRPLTNTGSVLKVVHTYTEPFVTLGGEPQTTPEEERFEIALAPNADDLKPESFSYKLTGLSEGRQIRLDQFALYEKYQSGEFATQYSNAQLADEAYKEKQFQLDQALQNFERRRSAEANAPLAVEKQLSAARKLRQLLHDARLAHSVVQAQAAHNERPTSRY